MAEYGAKTNEAAALLRRAANILSEGSGSSSQSVVNAVNHKFKQINKPQPLLPP
jgi:hypothetical protein